MSDDPVLLAEGLAKIYHDGERRLEVLRGVNLRLTAGRSLAIIGRSGTGKTTLLNLLGLLDRPSAGELHLAGYPTSTLSENQRARLRGRAIGFVFQHYHLLAELTALENVALGRAVAHGGGWGGANAARARELLATVGLSERADHKPARLSGGERQRVAIARALASEPALLLCDEPTGNLDPQTGAAVMDALWSAAAQSNAALIVVTHDELIARRADQTLRLTEGELRPLGEVKTA